jgi:hypothetical protein
VTHGPDEQSQENSVPIAAPSAGPTGRAPAGPAPATDVTALAREVADVVTAHPAVARLHGGPFGAIATHLPGRRLVGVRIGTRDEPVELGVVLHLDRPIPEVVPVLRREVARLCGGAAVDITVADVELPADLAALLRTVP